jgi:urease accessory protein
MSDSMETKGYDLLASLRLADSFLPVGTYSSSYGIESFIREDRINDSNDLRELLKDYLHFMIGSSDIIAISSVYDAIDRSEIDKIIHIDNKYHSMQTVKEFRKSSIKSGNNLLKLFMETNDYVLINNIHEDLPHGHYITVMALISNSANIKKIHACLVHSYSFVTELISAAQRLLGLSHIDVQQILSDLQPFIKKSCSSNIGKSVTQMQSFCPWISIMGMKHEREDVKLFMS